MQDYLDQNQDNDQESGHDNNIKDSQPVTAVTPSQKYAVAGLSFLAVFIVIFWGISFKQNINQPFTYNGPVYEEEQTACSGYYCNEDGSEDLRFVDTDQDSLSDWDELNIYNTSPYLEDSDSDGLSDSAELNTGEDPNCPVGKECFGFDAELEDDYYDYDETSDSNNSVAEDIESDLNSLNSIQASSDFQAEDIEKMLSGETDIATLRQLLIESGMEEEMLDLISDEDLQKSYLDLVSQ